MDTTSLIPPYKLDVLLSHHYGDLRVSMGRELLRLARILLTEIVRYLFTAVIKFLSTSCGYHFDIIKDIGASQEASTPQAFQYHVANSCEGIVCHYMRKPTCPGNCTVQSCILLYRRWQTISSRVCSYRHSTNEKSPDALLLAILLLESIRKDIPLLCTFGTDPSPTALSPDSTLAMLLATNLTLYKTAHKITTAEPHV